MKISVIICSRSGTPEGLKRDLAKQTLKPDEIIEIVGSSLTSQRNEGVAKASGDLITFLDDDVRVDPRYLERITEVFYQYPDAMAVTGNICVKAFQPNILHTILAHIFILSRSGQGKFLISGFPETYDRGILSVTKSEVLHGCNMTVRKEVFEEIAFNEDLEGGMYGEDDWFSYDVSKRFPIYYTPFAVCYDERDYPKGRQRWATRCRIINLIARHKKDKINSLAFWWSMFGFINLKIIEAIIMRDTSILKGVYDACLHEVSKR